MHLTFGWKIIICHTNEGWYVASQFARINDLESNVSDINKNELIWKLSRYYDLLNKVNKADNKLKEYDNNSGLINQFYENYKINKDNIYEICSYCNKKIYLKK